MDAGKKMWDRPELTVLVRSQPEEAVLGACKSATVSSATGPSKKVCSDPQMPAGCFNLNPS
jgi:hypothetical protein